MARSYISETERQITARHNEVCDEARQALEEIIKFSVFKRFVQWHKTEDERGRTSFVFTFEEVK